VTSLFEACHQEAKERRRPLGEVLICCERRWGKFITEQGHGVWHALSVMSSFNLPFNVIVFLILRSDLIGIKTFHCGTVSLDQELISLRLASSLSTPSQVSCQ
jgi:hypothetical protein